MQTPAQAAPDAPRPPSAPRTRTPVVDQHASWIAVNPIQGCPKSCTYCFLNDRGQTRVRPEVLATPDETVTQLLASRFYAPDRAVALFTWTDVMAVAASRAYLAELLAAMAGHGLPNPVVLITKCRIPDETIGQIAAARTGGLRVIVYLSYSSLDSTVENGIRHEHTEADFPALRDADIPIVHYWRPALPASATTRNMERVLDLAAAHAHCTMAAGLKVEPAALPRLAGLWPELATTPGVTEAEGVYPERFWEFIHSTRERYPSYPVFHANACALAFVLGESDRFGIFGSEVCTRRNACPAAQRDRCSRAARPGPGETDIASALASRGLSGVAHRYHDGDRLLVVHAAATNRVASALAQDLGVRVRLDGQGTGDTYWSSGTSGARPLIIPAGEPR